MRFKNLDEWFSAGGALRSREFILNDGHTYQLVRSQLANDGTYAYSLMCSDDETRHTVYLSESAMRTILARRDGEKLKRCLACGGSGEIGPVLAVDDITNEKYREPCEACEGRGEVAP